MTSTVYEIQQDLSDEQILKCFDLLKLLPHLLKWLMGEAKRFECDGIHLDTGIERNDAHRLYLNLGMTINGLHLSMDLD